jgi:hypothetical protein
MYANTNSMIIATHGILARSSSATPFSNTKSVEMDGVDDYIKTDATYTALNGLTKASFSVWIKPTSVSSLKLKITFDIGRGSYVRGDISSITYGSWNHIVVTVDLSLGSNQGTIYVNGADVTTSQSMGGASSFPTATDELYIGEAKNGQYNPYLGKIDELAIFPNTVLSASDVTSIYNSGTPTDLSTFSTPPSNWWRFEEGSGTTISDSIGSADATIVNQTSFSSDVPT